MAGLCPGTTWKGVKVQKVYDLPCETLLIVSSGSVVSFTGDAIVNAANTSCLTGGGVDGAITKAGGDKLKVARRALKEVSKGVRCPVGDARITIGGDLKARYCIHAVGPNYRAERKPLKVCDALVTRAYASSMALAAAEGLESIAFSLLSAGIFRGDQSLHKVLAAGVTGIVNGTYPELEEVHLVGFSPEELTTLGEVCEEFAAAGFPVNIQSDSKAASSSRAEREMARSLHDDGSKDREVSSSGGAKQESCAEFEELLLYNFRYFDANGDGLISKGELATVLQKLDPDYWTHVCVNELLLVVDKNCDGVISYEEFVAWLVAPETDDEKGPAELALEALDTKDSTYKSVPKTA